MKQMTALLLGASVAALLLVPASADPTRADGASLLPIPLTGSLQNACWSPDGRRLLLTRFRQGYNREPADLALFDLERRTARLLVADGSANVNLPGSSWNAKTDLIVFSSSREPHDEIYVISPAGEPKLGRRLTSRDALVAYEPSFSPDAEWVVFESHPCDVENEGKIMKVRADGKGAPVPLTPDEEDCRQPNWSPRGDRIVYQRCHRDSWTLWTVKPDGSDRRAITAEAGSQSDASFSPDGNWIVFSWERTDEEGANLWILPAIGGKAERLTRFRGYDGAPAWSPDGRRVAFESCTGDPDRSPGSRLWVIAAPVR